MYTLFLEGVLADIVKGEFFIRGLQMRTRRKIYQHICALLILILIFSDARTINAFTHDAVAASYDGNSGDPTTDPTDPATPADPTDPVDPATPTDPTDPEEPVTPTDPEDPGQRIKELIESGLTDVVTADIKDEDVTEDDRMSDIAVNYALNKGDVSESDNAYRMPVSITSDGLKKHTRQNKTGYWYGAAVSKSFIDALASEGTLKIVTGEYPDEEQISFDDAPVFEQHDADQTIGSGEEETGYYAFYFDASAITHIYVGIQLVTGEVGTYTIVYDVDASGIVLSRPEYTVSVSPSDSTITQRLIKKGSGTFSINIDAVVSNDEGNPIAKELVEWETVTTGAEDGADQIATVSTSHKNTNSEGVSTVCLEISDIMVGTVTLKAYAGGMSEASFIRFEIYDIKDDESIQMSLPDMDEYALSNLIILPEDSEYGLGWSSDDPETVSVNDEGVVLAHKRSPRVGIPVRECILKNGETVSDEISGGAKISAIHSIVVSVKLTGLSITSDGDPDSDIYYVGNTRTVFTLVPEPEICEFMPDEIETIIWRSSKEDIASIDVTGSSGAVPVLKKPGTTTIIATITVGGVQIRATRTITVLETASYVVITDSLDEKMESIRMLPEDSIQLTGHAYDSKDRLIDIESGIKCNIIWTSSNEKVAKVNPAGLVTTLDEGKAIITARDIYGEKYAELVIDSIWQVTQIIPEYKRVTLEEGATIDLDLSVIPQKIIAERYSFSAVSSDPSRATVNLSDGKLSITGVKAGTSVITISDSLSPVTVNIDAIIGGSYKPVIRITPLGDVVNMYTGETRVLSYDVVPADYTDTYFKWTSQTASVVRVDETTGEIIAVKKGTGIVSVSAMHDGKVIKKASYSVAVRQRPKPGYISITPKETVLNAPDKTIGIAAGSVYLMCHIFPDNVPASDIEWSSEDESIAAVSSLGRVTAVSGGTTYITAKVTCEDGDTVSQRAKITVVSEVADTDKDPEIYRENGIWLGHIEDLTYTGSKITPEPNVYCGSLRLNKGTDYTYSYSNNIYAAKNKNEPSVTVKLKGDYSGSITANFKILRRSITEAQISSVSVPIREKKGDAVKQYLDPVVMFDGRVLKKGRDYQLTYPDEESDDDAYKLPGKDGAGWLICVEGIGNFTGEAYTYEYIADKAVASDIARVPITLESTSYPYTGNEIRPRINFGSLTEHVDYEVTCSGNKAIGKGTVIVTGTGGYYGTKKLTFKIVKNPVSLASCELKAVINGEEVAVSKGRGNMEIPYMAGAIKPRVVLTDEEGNTIDTAGYSVTCKSNLKQMTGTITFKGKGNYYKDSAVVNFAITRQSIRELTPVVDDFVYSSKPEEYKKNKITIYDKNGKALKAGKDYSLSEWDAPSPAPYAGSVVTVVATGQGDYYDGTMLLSFTVTTGENLIKNAKAYFLDDDIEMEQSKYYVQYAGVPVQPKARDIVLRIRTGSGKNEAYTALSPDKYEVVGYLNNNRPGIASVLLRGRGNYAGIREVKFKIK